jgi:urease accessory protein UreF
MVEYIDEDRVTQLKALLEILAQEIDDKPGARDMASLARQYRETLREIEELEGVTNEDDEIGAILAERNR